MAKAAAAVPKKTGIEIQPIKTAQMKVAIIGTSPLIFNRVNAKAQRELLLPFGKRRTKADRAGRLKHNPIEEYRDSVYRYRVDQATRLCFPAPGPKAAMASAALDLPGTAKKEIGRLTWVEGERVPIFGVPKLFMAIVRSADINKTPDVRTRAIVEKWASVMLVNYVTPNLNQASMINLMNAAGILAGLGDGRQEKGKLSFGQFRICNETDADFKEIMKTGARKAQDAALKEPDFYDDDSAELLEWFDVELADRIARGAEVAPTEDDNDE